MEERITDLTYVRLEYAHWREMQKRDKEREAEQCLLVHQQNLRAFYHDHDYGEKRNQEEVIIQEQPREVNGSTVNEVGIPVEVGKCLFVWRTCIIIICISECQTDIRILRSPKCQRKAGSFYLSPTTCPLWCEHMLQQDICSSC